MAISFVQTKLGTSTTATTSPSFDTAPTLGNLIVLAFSADDFNVNPDSGWTQSSQMEQQVNHGGYLWWRISDGSNPPGSYTISSTTHSVWVLAEFSGFDASPYDVSLGGSSVSSSTFYATPSLTPTAGSRLLVAAVGGSSSASGIAAGAYDSWTNSFTEAASGGVNISYYDCVGLAYRIITADGSTSYSTTADYNGAGQANTHTGLIISFKESTGAAPPKFASKGTLGANGTTTANQANIVLTTATTNVAIGDLAVIVVAVDNTSTTDQDAGEISGVTSSPANTWTKAREWTNGQGTAQTGATVSMWYTVATAAMNTGSTITAAFTTSSSADAQGIIGWCFTKPAGAVKIEATNILATDGADPAALDATTRNIECLRIRAIGSEGAASGNAPSLTPTANWTAWGDGNSTLAMTAAEMYARAEHIISVGTGASSNPTGWAADNANVYVAFAPPSYMFFEPKISPRKNTLLRM